MSLSPSLPSGAALETLIADIRANPDRYRVSREIELSYLSGDDVDALKASGNENIGKAAIIDVEATDKDPKTAEILAVAILPVWYDKTTLEVLGIEKPSQWYNDPSVEISQEIQNLTGITPEMVKGHRLDIDAIEAISATTDIFIAHYASYDRVITERYMPFMSRKAWACTCEGLPWKEFGFDSSKLRHILQDMGFFYEAHRADIDCIAVAKMLEQNIPENQNDKENTSLHTNSGKLFSKLIENARMPRYSVEMKIGYSENHLIKAIGGYLWNPEKKVWHKNETAENLMKDMDAIKKSFPKFPPSHIYRIGPLNRFSEREGRVLGAEEIQNIFGEHSPEPSPPVSTETLPVRGVRRVGRPTSLSIAPR